jgi:tetratricopeptide (TPR) repeat protein
MRIVLALWLLAAPALAQEAPSSDAQQEARQLATRARRDYDAHRYAAALRHYERAYELYAAPGLLFNLGQCHRELGHHELAIDHFERYLAARPDAPNRGIVRDLIEESRRAIAPTQTAAAIAEAERARRELREAQESGAVAVAEAQAELDAAEAALAEARAREEALRAAIVEAPREPEVYETWWFWTVIVGVAALVAGGVAIGVVVSQQEPSLPFGSLGTIDAR